MEEMEELGFLMRRRKENSGSSRTVCVCVTQGPGENVGRGNAGWGGGRLPGFLVQEETTDEREGRQGKEAEKEESHARDSVPGLLQEKREGGKEGGRAGGWVDGKLGFLCFVCVGRAGP